MVKNTKSNQGFTIIEVVLVLAIAGLIFLMVFIALPALQRSQRDTQRRQDYADLSAAISSYATNNNGKLTKLSDKDQCKGNVSAATYINKDGNDPNGKTYKLYACTPTTLTKDKPDETEVFVVIGADCSGTNADGNDKPAANSSSRAYAVYGYLEAGNGTYCTESQ